MGAVKEALMKKYVTEIPRYVAVIEATDEEECKEYLADEVRSLIDSSLVTIEDITGKEAPSAIEAAKSRTRNLLNKGVNIVETSRNITKVTGGTAYLGVGGADVVFNKDAANFFSITKFVHDNKEVDFSAKEGVITNESFFSFGTVLKNYATLFSTPVKAS